MELGSFALASLDFGTLPQQLVNGLLLGAIYALVALGYTMVYGVLRLINFAHGEVFMLGAYAALFVSWNLGFSEAGLASNPDIGSSALNLVLMLLVSMATGAVVGMLIEFFAYRPLRNEPRIAALITAIGVSLLLQYGGALVLPNSPQPSIDERVNPFRQPVVVQLVAPNPAFAPRIEAAQTRFEAANRTLEAALAREKAQFGVDSAFDLRDQAPRRQMQAAESELKRLKSEQDSSAVRVIVPQGQLIMLVTSLVLMLILRWLVMKTRVGRNMRAVAHDFDTAALMGVNVNRVISFTFFIGSALAGAGAMMNATFMGTPLDTFYGVKLGVKAFVAAVLGGIGNIPGAVLGGLVMGVAETLVVWAGYSSYRDAIALVILIVVLLFRPGGLLGSSKVEKV